MLKSVLGLSVFAILLAGCTDDDESNFCKPYCSDWWSANENYAEIQECPIPADKMSNYKTDCQIACENAYVTVENHLTQDVEPCIDCIHSDIGDEATPPSFDTSMRSNCQTPCSKLGAKQFMGSFFVPEPFPNCK